MIEEKGVWGQDKRLVGHVQLHYLAETQRWQTEPSIVMNWISPPYKIDKTAALPQTLQSTATPSPINTTKSPAERYDTFHHVSLSLPPTLTKRTAESMINRSLCTTLFYLYKTKKLGYIYTVVALTLPDRVSTRQSHSPTRVFQVQTALQLNDWMENHGPQ